MSVAEMKLEAIKKITSIEDETILREILAVLKESTGTTGLPYHLSSTYDEVKNQYGAVLQKLAQ